MQIMNFYFIGNGQGKNSLLTKHHFILLKLTRKVVFQGGFGVTFSNFYRGERLFTVYRCMTFCGIIELYKRKENITLQLTLTDCEHW